MYLFLYIFCLIIPLENAGRAQKVSTTKVASGAGAVSDMDPDFASGREHTIVTTSVIIEPDVPNPFLVDDSESSSDSGSESVEKQDETTNQPPIAEEAVALAQSNIVDAPQATGEVAENLLLSPDVDKAMPQIPALSVELLNDEDEDEDEEEVPDLYIPGLIAPTMFLPIPNVCSSNIYSLPVANTVSDRSTHDITDKIRTSGTKTFPRFVWTMASR
jgi:hypothetical protein